jgi:hypothetical protein
MNEPEHWAKRALAHGRVLSRSIGLRGATGDGEQRAAGYVRNELQQLGLRAARLEPFRGSVSIWMPWSIAFSLALWGVFAGLFLGWLGSLVALAMHLLAIWILWRELYPFGDYPVRRWLWRGDSQNVVAVVPPAGPVQGRVVLMGYLDSARAPFFWRAPGRRRLAWLLVWPLLFSVPANALLLFLGALTGSVWLYCLTTPLVLCLIVGLVISLRAERAPFAPGANNNASGLAMLLALAERLKQAPLARTEVWLLASGCRETGGDGARAFLDAHGETLAPATFIALEGVGVGQRVVYLDGEGLLYHTRYSPRALALAAQAAERCRQAGLEVGVERHRGGPAEMGLITRRGFEGLSINVWPDQERGVAGRRRADDVFETLEQEALEKAHTFAWELLQEIDAAAQT